jgi:hypothetical protein
MFANERLLIASHRVACGTITASEELLVDGGKGNCIDVPVLAVGDSELTKACGLNEHSLLLASRGCVGELAGVLNLNHVRFPFV